MKISLGIERKIVKAARKAAQEWPIEANGRPVSGLSRAILDRMGLGRDTGGEPVISQVLSDRIKKAGFAAVREAWM